MFFICLEGSTISRDITIRLVVEGGTQAADAIKSVNDELADTKGAATGTGDAFSQITGKLQTLAISYLSIKGLQMAGEFLAQGEAALRTQSVFASLTQTYGTSDAVLQGLSESTQGYVTNLDLMKEASHAASLGIFTTSQEMDNIASVSEKLAMDVGGNASTALATFADSISTGRITNLKQYGINVIDLRDSIKKLMEGGLDKLDATKTAVLDAAGLALDRMGQNAQDAIDPVKQLSTTWSNFTDTLSIKFATLANQEITTVSQMATLWNFAQQRGDNVQMGATRSGVSQSAFDAQVAMTSGAGMAPGGAGFNATQQVKADAVEDQYKQFLAQKAAIQVANNQQSLLEEGRFSQAIANVQAQRFMTLTANYAQTLQERSRFDNAMAAQNATLLAQQQAAGSTSFGAVMGGAQSFIGSSGTIGKFMQADDAKKYSDELQTITSQYTYMSSLKDSGFITQDQLDAVGGMKDKVKELADQAKTAADNLKNMTLSQFEGTGGGGLGGDNEDAVLKAMRAAGRSKKDIAAVQDSLDMQTGRQTVVGKSFNTQIQSLAGLSPDQITKAIAAMTTFEQQAMALGLDPTTIAGGLGGASGFDKNGKPVKGFDPTQYAQGLLLQQGGAGGAKTPGASNDFVSDGHGGFTWSGGAPGAAGGAKDMSSMTATSAAALTNVTALSTTMSSAKTSASGFADALARIPSIKTFTVKLLADDPLGLLGIIGANGSLGTGAGIGGGSPGGPVVSGSQAGTMTQTSSNSNAPNRVN